MIKTSTSRLQFVHEVAVTIVLVRSLLSDLIVDWDGKMMMTASNNNGDEWWRKNVDTIPTMLWRNDSR